MNKIAIMGAGSLGTVLGAYLSKADVKVDLIDVNQAHVDALNEKGAKVIGQVSMLEPVTALTPDEMTGIYDLIILITKQTYNDSVFEQLKKVTDESSIICTLQNGIPEIPVSRAFSEKQTIGAPVGWGASWIEPGVSELTSDPTDMTFTLGTYSGEETPALLEIKDILEKMCPVQVSSNLMGIRWAKLLVNATFSGLSTCLGSLFGGILDDDRALKVVSQIGKETIQVCQASGVTMEMVNGVSLAEVLWYENDGDEKNLFPVYKQIFTPHAKLKASMLQDIEKGLHTEIDAINGVVCDEGVHFNIPTPANDMVREIVKKIEAGELKPEFKNIELFN